MKALKPIVGARNFQILVVPSADVRSLGATIPKAVEPRDHRAIIRVLADADDRTVGVCSWSMQNPDAVIRQLRALANFIDKNRI